jgi:hypothetical protein
VNQLDITLHLFANHHCQRRERRRMMHTSRKTHMAENTAQCRHRWPAPLPHQAVRLDAAKLQDTAALVLRA